MDLASPLLEKVAGPYPMASKSDKSRYYRLLR